MVLRPRPAADPPRRPLLPLLDALHPGIPALEAGLADMHPGQGGAVRRMRGPEVDLVAALALERGVAREHVEVPQGEAGGQAGLLAQGDGGGEVQEAEVGFPLLGAHAHADELDFRDEEAVAGVALAHQPVQVRQPGEVERLLAVLLLAHARVPDLVRLDESDDAAPAERLGLVVGVRGEIERTVFFGALRAHGDVVLMALAGLERCVDFGNVDGVQDVLKGAFVGGLDEGLIALGLRESRGWNGNVEEAGAFFAVGEIGNGQDGIEVEIFPIFQISNVPPRVHVVAKARGDFFNQCHRWVGSCQVFHHGGCRPIEAELGSQITIPS